MKIIFLGLSCLLALAQAQGQGLVRFNNSTSTRIVNAVTGQPVQSAEGIVAGLYYAPIGTTNEADFSLAATASIVDGRFTGGDVAIPDYPPGSELTLQVRAWEWSYGETYEAAKAAPEMNGRRALLGTSMLMEGTVGGGILPVPTLVSSFAFQGFAVDVYVEGPFISINDIVVSEGTNGTKLAVFTVSLDEPGTQMVKVDFATVDGTALAGQDYVSTNGTLEFLPGETSLPLAVILTADEPHELDEAFAVHLSNPVQGAILKAIGQCTITEVVISGIRLDAVVSFHTLSNHIYRLESTMDLLEWTTVADVAGTGSIVTVTDQGAGCNSFRIYRARLLE